MTKQLECMELHLGMDNEQAESLWVRIKKQTSLGDSVVGVGCRTLDKEVDEVFCRKIEVTSCS